MATAASRAGERGEGQAGAGTPTGPVPPRPPAVPPQFCAFPPQPLFLMGAPDGVAAVLHDVIRPRAAYVAGLPAHLAAVERIYRVAPGPPRARMWVGRGSVRAP